MVGDTVTRVQRNVSTHTTPLSRYDSVLAGEVEPSASSRSPPTRPLLTPSTSSHMRPTWSPSSHREPSSSTLPYACKHTHICCTCHGCSRGEVEAHGSVMKRSGTRSRLHLIKRCWLLCTRVTYLHNRWLDGGDLRRPALVEVGDHILANHHRATQRCRDGDDDVGAPVEIALRPWAFMQLLQPWRSKIAARASRPR